MAAELRCDQVRTCRAPVTHIDEDGYVYCAPHGADRRSVCRVRKIKPAELQTLQAGRPIWWDATRNEAQPALPGDVGAVRGVEVPHPTIPLPPADFALTPPTSTEYTQLALTETGDDPT